MKKRNKILVLGLMAVFITIMFIGNSGNMMVYDFNNSVNEDLFLEGQPIPETSFTTSEDSWTQRLDKHGSTINNGNGFM